MVGIRSEFVLELLNRVSHEGGGFTVFGDEAQAIYDFQMRTERGERSEHPSASDGSARIRLWRPSERGLRTNYRMSAERLSPLAEHFGESLRGPERNPMEIMRELRREIGEEPAWRDEEDAAAEIDFVTSADWCESAAVLCRYNAEVLTLGARLQRAGLDVRVQHRAEDRGGAPWLALLFGPAEFSKAQIPEPLPDLGADAWFQPPDDLPVLLRHAGSGPPDGGGSVEARRAAS